MKIPAFPRAVLWLALLCGLLNYSQAPYGSQSFDLSISQQTAYSPEHSILQTALRSSGLEETLNSDGPFTVFAPSDTAFNQLSDEQSAYLMAPENIRMLQSVMTYHIVAGKLTAAKILSALCRGKGKTTFTTVQGSVLTATIDGIDIVLTDDFGTSARITAADMEQCNGVIHVIDAVILPVKL